VSEHRPQTVRNRRRLRPPWEQTQLSTDNFVDASSSRWLSDFEKSTGKVPLGRSADVTRSLRQNDRAVRAEPHVARERHPMIGPAVGGRVVTHVPEVAAVAAPVAVEAQVPGARACIWARWDIVGPSYGLERTASESCP